MNAPTRAILTVAAIAAAFAGGWYVGHQGGSSSSSGSSTTSSADQQNLQALGWLMGRQPVKLLALSADDIDQVAIGMKSILKNGTADIVDPPGGDDAMQKAQDYLQDRQDKTAKADAAKLDGLQKDLFAKLDKDSTVQKTSDGLYYQIITPGTDPKPTMDSVVSVNYTGKLATDEVFDKSRDKPSDLPVGEVVPGFQEGLKLIGKGGKIKLWIPGNLAYGANPPSPIIPADAALIFDVEITDIKAAPPPDASSAGGMQGIPPELMQQIMAAQAAQGNTTGNTTSGNTTGNITVGGNTTGNMTPAPAGNMTAPTPPAAPMPAPAPAPTAPAPAMTTPPAATGTGN
jgi:FKBP-type peptidyl-prolyl cis-trans isomerase